MMFGRGSGVGICCPAVAGGNNLADALLNFFCFLTVEVRGKPGNLAVSASSVCRTRRERKRVFINY